MTDEPARRPESHEKGTLKKLGGNYMIILQRDIDRIPSGPDWPNNP